MHGRVCMCNHYTLNSTISILPATKKTWSLQTSCKFVSNYNTITTDVIWGNRKHFQHLSQGTMGSQNSLPCKLYELQLTVGSVDLATYQHNKSCYWYKFNLSGFAGRYVHRLASLIRSKCGKRQESQNCSQQENMTSLLLQWNSDDITMRFDTDTSDDIQMIFRQGVTYIYIYIYIYIAEISYTP